MFCLRLASWSIPFKLTGSVPRCGSLSGCLSSGIYTQRKCENLSLLQSVPASCDGFPSKTNLSFSNSTQSVELHHSHLNYNPVRYYGHYEKWTDLCYEDFVALADSGDIQLFDVREPREIKNVGSFHMATNIPLGQVKEALKLDDAKFAEHYKVAKPQVHDTNVVFVAFGPIKSSAALEISHKMGYKKARRYVGGYEEWSKRQLQRT